MQCGSVRNDLNLLSRRLKSGLLHIAKTKIFMEVRTGTLKKIKLDRNVVVKRNIRNFSYKHRQN